MVWRVVDQAENQVFAICEIHHPRQKLTAMTAAFRAVIHVHYKPLDAIQPRLVFLPPQLNTIHHEVACFTALCEKEKRAAGCHFQYSAGHQFRFGHHVVVRRSHRSQATRKPTP